jgi:hypothetical protein
MELIVEQAAITREEKGAMGTGCKVKSDIDFSSSLHSREALIKSHEGR